MLDTGSRVWGLGFRVRGLGSNPAKGDVFCSAGAMQGSCDLQKGGRGRLLSLEKLGLPKGQCIECTYRG